MSKQALFIGAIASIIAINSVLADTTVTSKQYVDTTRQATIPAAGTNASTPGSAVVTYTGTAGQIGERFICDADADDNGYCDDDNLVTFDLLGNQISGLNDQMDDFDNYISEQIQQVTNLPQTASTNKVCVAWEPGMESGGDAYCILWNLVDTLVYGFPACQTAADCNGFAQSCPMRMARCDGWPSHCECDDGAAN